MKPHAFYYTCAAGEVKLPQGGGKVFGQKALLRRPFLRMLV
jgi:hypothetical protein